MSAAAQAPGLVGEYPLVHGHGGKKVHMKLNEYMHKLRITGFGY